MTRIDLPEELADAVESRIEGTDFDSVEEYVLFVVGEVVAERDEETDDDSRPDVSGVEGRLEDLGYL